MSKRILRYDVLSTFMKATYLIVAGSDIAYRTTIATAMRMPMMRRARRGSDPDTRSKRISSLSFSQKAVPSNTMYNQVMTDSSAVQPMGKLKKYRKMIWTMKATTHTHSK